MSPLHTDSSQKPDTYKKWRGQDFYLLVCGVGGKREANRQEFSEEQ